LGEDECLRVGVDELEQVVVAEILAVVLDWVLMAGLQNEEGGEGLYFVLLDKGIILTLNQAELEGFLKLTSQ
jgi:hypothetical protein